MPKIKLFKLLFTVMFFSTFYYSYKARAQNVFTKTDSLRGSLTSPLRTCYDVNYYHLNIKISIDKQFISGYNEFRFTATNNFRQLQFDLFENFTIQKIVYNGKSIPFKRLFNAVFINFPKGIKKDTKATFRVYYSGKPIVAKNPPWDGGFIFSKHTLNQDFVSTSCQGLGASSWWPNKDQQADEPDSMLISISVPKHLKNISNGRLRSIKKVGNDYLQYNWFVSQPINNYSVTANIANYVNIKDSYKGLNGKLSLDYFVLPEHAKKAKKHFDANVKKMLEAFEYWFGPYPFYKDGYKLIETPFLGMEHQTAIAYGNDFQNGYNSIDLSDSGWGLKWDFIIIHESAHEWFGNNITSKDIADMWIHESFTNYAESLFTEYWYGKAAGNDYVIGLRNRVLNDKPVIGNYGVNNEGSGDMYYKGANMLHTIRTIINNDEKWRAILTGLNTEFALKTVTTECIVNYINKSGEIDFTKIFDQYLKFVNLPVLEIKQEKNTFNYRWNCDVKNFNMPLEIDTGNGNYQKITATDDWKTINTQEFKVKKDYYIKIESISN